MRAQKQVDEVPKITLLTCKLPLASLAPTPNLPRTRSYSLDGWLNNDATRIGLPPENFRPYLKTKSAQLLNPVQIFTLIDEHEQSIDDGSFFTVFLEVAAAPENANKWASMPSDRHNQGCSVAFADGHVLPWRWKAAKQFKQINQPAVGEDLKDLRQLQTWVPRE